MRSSMVRTSFSTWSRLTPQMKRSDTRLSPSEETASILSRPSMVDTACSTGRVIRVSISCGATPS